MEFLKKYWFLITFVVAPLGVALVWIVSIDSRTFESPEQRVKHENHINNALTPNEEYQKFVQDTMMRGAIRRDKEVGFKIWFNRPYLTDENRFDLKSRQLDYEKFPSPVSNIVCFNYNGDLSELIKGYFDKLLRKQVKNQ